MSDLVGKRKRKAKIKKIKKGDLRNVKQKPSGNKEGEKEPEKKEREREKSKLFNFRMEIVSEFLPDTHLINSNLNLT